MLSPLVVVEEEAEEMTGEMTDETSVVEVEVGMDGHTTQSIASSWTMCPVVQVGRISKTSSGRLERSHSPSATRSGKERGSSSLPAQVICATQCENLTVPIFVERGSSCHAIVMTDRGVEAEVAAEAVTEAGVEAVTAVTEVATRARVEADPDRLCNDNALNRLQPATPHRSQDQNLLVDDSPFAQCHSF